MCRSKLPGEADRVEGMDIWEVGVIVETGCLLRSSQARSRVSHRRMRSLVWNARDSNAIAVEFCSLFFGFGGGGQ